EAQAALKQPLTSSYRPRATASFPTTSTGRRLAFARWLTSQENPLTARVAVNQIWMRHFAQGLVPTVENFGAQGQPPTHPQLLDWLAATFMETTDDGRRTTPAWRRSRGRSSVVGSLSSVARPGFGWRMKALHRLIVTSSTYRMASTADPADAARDPDNRYLWRMNSRRMDAELVRDNVLFVA